MPHAGPSMPGQLTAGSGLLFRKEASPGMPGVEGVVAVKLTILAL